MPKQKGNPPLRPTKPPVYKPGRKSGGKDLNVPGRPDTGKTETRSRPPERMKTTDQND